MSDGHPDRSAVERVGAGRIEQEAGHPERGGIAEEGPDVLVIIESLEDGDQPRSSVPG